MLFSSPPPLTESADTGGNDDDEFVLEIEAASLGDDDDGDEFVPRGRSATLSCPPPMVPLAMTDKSVDCDSDGPARTATRAGGIESSEESDPSAESAQSATANDAKAPGCPTGLAQQTLAAVERLPSWATDPRLDGLAQRSGVDELQERVHDIKVSRNSSATELRRGTMMSCTCSSQVEAWEI